MPSTYRAIEGILHASAARINRRTLGWLISSESIGCIAPSPSCASCAARGLKLIALQNADSAGQYPSAVAVSDVIRPQKPQVPDSAQSGLRIVGHEYRCGVRRIHVSRQAFFAFWGGASATAASSVSSRKVSVSCRYKADRCICVAEIADGGILADVQFEVAAARGQHKSAGNRRRPDDLFVDEALDVLQHRISMVAGLSQCGVRISSEDH